MPYSAAQTRLLEPRSLRKVGERLRPKRDWRYSGYLECLTPPRTRIRPFGAPAPEGRREKLTTAPSGLLLPQGQGKVGPSQRQAQARDAAARVGAVLQRQRAAVRLDDLPREHEADAGAAGFGREERHEQVFARRQAGPVVDRFRCSACRRVRAPAQRARRRRSSAPRRSAFWIRLISACSIWSGSTCRCDARARRRRATVDALFEPRRRAARARRIRSRAVCGGGSRASAV